MQKAPDPEGPVEPLDLPEIPDMPEIPIDISKPDIRIDRDTGVTVSGEIEGVPMDVTLGRDGVDVRTRENKAARR